MSFKDGQADKSSLFSQGVQLKFLMAQSKNFKEKEFQ